MTALALISWFHVTSFLQAQEPGTHVCLRASQVEHPRDAGMAPALMVPIGQRANYRLDLQESQQLLVLDFTNYYLARIDSIDMKTRLDAARCKTPASSIIGIAALGAMIGLACGRSQEAAFAGAALGGIVALASLTMAPAHHSHSTKGEEKSKAAPPQGGSNRQRISTLIGNHIFRKGQQT
jgi:hypothetical protein